MHHTARAWRVVGAAFAAAIAVAASGCTDEPSTAGASSGDRMSATELRWLRVYVRWWIDVYYDQLGRVPGQQLVRACGNRLEKIGPPPTSRLEPIRDRAAAACPFLSHPGTVRRANDVLEDASLLVRPLLMDNHDLRLSASPTRESRADMRLSSIASTVAKAPQEVRCWTDEDWGRLVRESNVWNAEDRDPTALSGFQDGDTGRIHMRLSQCNFLHRLRGEDVQKLSRKDQIEMADSVDTLAHEIQHAVLPNADEDEVECAAASELERTALRLGATDQEATWLLGIYVSEIRPDFSGEYLSPCEGDID